MPRSFDAVFEINSRAPVNLAAASLPLYRSLPDRTARWAHTVEEIAAAADELDDPFGGRHDSRFTPSAFVQIARDLPLYSALARNDLMALTNTTVRAWVQLGITPGDRIAFYDYATSPAVLFASRSYVAHLDAGAADILGCLPICNDGLPELADRCVHIFRYFQPSTLFIDAELVEPLQRALADSEVSTRPARVVVTADETVADDDLLRHWQTVLGVKVTQMMRVDVALMIAPPCPVRSMTFHPDGSSYRVEVVDSSWNLVPGQRGRLMVTNLALGSTVVVRYVTGISGTVFDGPCDCGRTGPIVEVTNDS